MMIAAAIGLFLPKQLAIIFGKSSLILKDFNNPIKFKVFSSNEMKSKTKNQILSSKYAYACSN
jgi:hypothetical protein